MKTKFDQSVHKDWMAAFLFLAIGTALRVLFFAELGRGTAYLTYYPSVVLAAFSAGFWPDC